MRNSHFASAASFSSDANITPRKSIMKTVTTSIAASVCSTLAAIGLMTVCHGTALAAESGKAVTSAQGADNFYQSTQVSIQKVRFKNQYNMEIVGNLVTPKQLNRSTQNPAIIVGHPMGAVKEQSAMLYAQKMAEQGFVTLAIDLPFWGESAGQPRNLVAPELYADAFSAAVDYLSTQTFIHPQRIGVLGICGSGGFAISAAKIDPRLQAIATVSMYDMGAVTRNGLHHVVSLEQRQALLEKGVSQRQTEFTTGKPLWLSYLPEKLSADTDAVTREFWEFYRTPRGIHIPKGRTLELTQNRMLSSEIRFVNFYPFNDIASIAPRPLLFIAGDQAHSREFSEEAYRLAAAPKELYWVAGAGHVDLYDRANLIPWQKLGTFFQQHLAK